MYFGFFYFLKVYEHDETSLSNSRSCSVCRVGEDGGSSSFLTRSSYVQSFPSLVGSLALTSESRRFSGRLYVIIVGLENIIFSLTFFLMIFQCLRRACLIYFLAKWGLYLVLKTGGIDVDLCFSLMKCLWSSKLIEESALEGSVFLYPLTESFSMKKSPFRQICRYWCCFLQCG